MGAIKRGGQKGDSFQETADQERATDISGGLLTCEDISIAHRYLGLITKVQIAQPFEVWL